MNTIAYPVIRNRLRTGDLVAFYGRGFVSNAIRLRTLFSWPPWGTNPSHIGIVLETKHDDFDEYNPDMPLVPVRRVNLIESTSLKGATGVQVTRLSKRLETYDGRIAVALVKEEYSTFDRRVRALEEGLRHNGKPYDFKGALGAGLAVIHAKNDATKLFCSELACRMHQAAHWLPFSLNPDEITPKKMLAYKHVLPPVEVLK